MCFFLATSDKQDPHHAGGHVLCISTEVCKREGGEGEIDGKGVRGGEREGKRDGKRKRERNRGRK